MAAAHAVCLERGHSSISVSQSEQSLEFEPQCSSVEQPASEILPRDAGDAEQCLERGHSSISVSQSEQSLELEPQCSSVEQPASEILPRDAGDTEQCLERGHSSISVSQSEQSLEFEPQCSSVEQPASEILPKDAGDTEQCPKHRLVCGDMSAFDKCIHCLGPFASLKWMGFKCKDCPGLWHLTCYRRMMGQDSSDLIDSMSSGSEYVPDSESGDSDSDSTQEAVFSQHFSSGMWKILSSIKVDEIGLTLRNDLSIVHFAQSLYNRHGQDPTKHEYMRQKLREVGRLLVCLRHDFSIHSLEEAIKPCNFQNVVQAVQKVAGFDEEKLSYRTPSLALKLGHTLNKICNIIQCRALMAEDDRLVKSAETFSKLYTSKWCELVSHSALNTLSTLKYNKPSTLPFTEDVRTLHQYLQKSADAAVGSLTEEATSKTYAELSKVILAQIILFNRRRAGEVSKMLLKSFEERDRTKLHQDVAMALSKLEQQLCSYFTRVEIVGKRGRKVVVLLTPCMVDALSLLTSKRKECGVHVNNIFLFGRPQALSHYRGQDCLRVYASQCGAKHPELLRSTQLRKHVATLSQILNLKNNELDQVADFLGHDIRVHRDFYRLPVPTMQLAKISKLLLSMEKGNLSGLQGKSLDEIQIEDEISFSDTEAKDSGSDSEDSSTEAKEPQLEDMESLGQSSGCPIVELSQNSEDSK
uniref:Uncharacterized protein n=1 Tax=Knipowitschia caucasica TaxID=637954 RepID=A0AAV2JNT2_KNICA